MSFLKWLAIFLIFGLLLFLLAIPCLAKERVGVLGFSGDCDDEFKLAAANELTGILFNFGRYELVERVEMERILEEQKFQLSGLVDQSTAVEVGKILSLSQVYIGSIDQLSGGWDGRLQIYRAEAKVTVKLVEVETARILNIFAASGFGSDVNPRTALHDALHSCFGQGMVAKIRNKIAPFSTVISVEGGYVYFDNGADVGIQKGMRYQIFRPLSDFGDVEVDFTDSFKRQIGLVEVVDVVESKSMAKVIWNSEVIRSGDILKEGGSNGWGIYGLDVHTTDTLTDNVMTFEGSVGYELPFKSSGKVNVGFTPLNVNDVNFIWIWNFGFQMGWELPIIPGTLYLEPTGGAGLAIANQTYTSYWGEKAVASSLGLYLNGGAGLKCYLDHENGMRLVLAMVAQWGPYFDYWDDEDLDVTPLVMDKTIGISGYGWQLTVTMPL
jgi:hypothetical protein